ncbi:MAG TPA: DUF456 domain-containing protein [Anaerolineae bacterium]
MALLLDSLTFGLAVVFIVIGLIGTVVPMLPGTLLIWLTILVYAILTGFTGVTPLGFAVLTVIALVTGTADFWMSLLGARTGGASKRAILFGLVGAIVGTFVIPLFGTIVGYGLGVLLGEYQKRGNWEAALRAGLGGLAGWGVATIIQLGGGLLMFAIFVWLVLPAFGD